MALKHELMTRARKQRKNQTPAERTVWSRVRRKQLGYKFRRQHVLVPYIVDFYCCEKKLVVEVDGPVHDSEVANRQDEERDALLERRHGVVKVLRFTNTEVVEEIEAIVERIEEELEAI